MGRLTGKYALITGGSSGIGLETARRFIEEGAKVAITGSNPSSLAAAGLELGDVVTIEADAGDVSAQQHSADVIRDRFGCLDVLFLNAGVARYGSLDNLDEATFQRSFDINVKGPLFLAQAMLPLFRNPASIILNGSINARFGKANSIVYSATKAAAISIARTLSGELSRRGIRANVISPGPTETPIFDKLGLSEEASAKIREALISSIPAGRFGLPQEIADAAVYLASDESRFTVGSEITIDGGLSIA